MKSTEMNSKIKKVFILIMVVVAFAACKSVKLPTVEESQKIIDNYKSRVDSLDRLISSKSNIPRINNDIVMKASMDAINKISTSISYKRDDDIKLFFLKKQDFMREDKNVLGIKYSNYLNIDTGYVSIDLKLFKIDGMNSDKVNATIELEGKGFISVSGKYTGIPASVSPEVQMYLKEPISFELIPSAHGNVTFKPLPKKILLKTKFAVSLLQWKVPYYQEVPLEITDMVKPITMPVSFSTEMPLPLPAQKFGGQQVEYVPYKIDFLNTKLLTLNNKIEYRTDLKFSRK